MVAVAAGDAEGRGLSRDEREYAVVETGNGPDWAREMKVD